MTPEQSTALRIARLMIDNGVPREVAIDNQAIPVHLRDFVREALDREETIILVP